MKILVINIPSFSHNVPTIGFLAELVKRSYNVDVVSSSILFPDPALKNLILSTGANYIDCEMPDNNDISNEDIDEYDPIGGLIAYMCEVALEYATRIKYDVIIYDFFLFPVYYFASLTNTPVIRFYSSWVYNEVLYDRMFSSNEKENNINKWFVVMQNTVMNCLKSKNFKFSINNVRGEMIYNIPPFNIVGLLQEMQPCSNEIDERFIYVGASIVSSESNIEVPLERVSAGKVIYASFGTLVNIVEGDKGKELFEKIIEAFLNEDVFVFMSIGNGMPMDDLPNIPENFFISSFLPQTEILPYSDLFISHGGMNSVNESIYYGVPMLAVPSGQDQIITAEQIEYRKIGKKLLREFFTPVNIKKAYNEILIDDEIKSNVKKMQEKIRSSDSASQTADIIENFIKQNK